MRTSRLVISSLAVMALVITAFFAAQSSSSPIVGEGAEMRLTTRARTVAGAKAVPFTKTFEAVPSPKGWSNQTLVGPYNDWEPAVALDPNGQYVYMLTTRYGAKMACNSCRHNGIALTRSDDNGATWKKWDWLWEDGAGWQADPQIVVDGNGDVHAAVLVNPYVIYYMKSIDHGATWSEPVDVIGTQPWGDHQWLAVSPDGMDVYISFNRRYNLQTTSNDGGATWSEPVQTNLPEDMDYYFANGATVLPDESVVFAAAAYGCCPYNDFAHKKPIDVWVIRSDDHGATWTQTKVDTMAVPPPCTSEFCPKAWWGSLPSIASDADGDLLLFYSGGRVNRGPTRMWFRTSTDGGLTWSAAKALSPPAHAGFPMAAGTGDGDFRVAWPDDRNGPNRFNIWYRETDDHGATWSNAVRLSNLGGGQPYKHPAGFEFYYGDYSEMDIDAGGRTFVLWSEAANWNGPGTAWYAKQNTQP